ncbi:DUF1403 family protein [Mesorhizobium sp. M7A.F.Ca.US.010.02.1.1]|uniref:DUF1403 family protein n=1 Tax=Mesorhizobium sp. M7A.F.Ca.US.010.02.1.1 TaxID=2496743 RepID=UPI000FD3359C|nr:DUF1403 family protein [Mesorhizobium sp. M7A.F.Ca.US.010.02.1.1]RUW90238.1 DUF1403 family protein [Mesorhizobium sp. M7A.F.Ca.US.010.02.1.1]
MKSRLDLPPDHRSVVPKVPAWARPRGDVQRDVDAGYLAGAAVNSLDNLVRSSPDWAGVWRQRLALKSASAAIRLLGRREEEGALRDAHFFRAGGDNPGPAGNILLAWRRLASRSTGLDEASVRPVAEHLDVKWDDALAEVLSNAEDLAASSRPAPLLGAELAAELYRARPDAELLAFWLADALVAKKHRWPVAVPLLMGQVNSVAFRIGEGRRRVRPGGEGWGRAVLVAYCMAAAEACDVGADLAGRAAHLVEVSPKLRAKGAGEVVKLLLDDDAVPPSRSGAGLTDRSARRLFERLGELGAVRELSGRSTFRLYGL